MARILITGMSGTGKSSALRGLAARGHVVADTDTDVYSHWTADGGDWIWRLDAVAGLLDRHEDVFVAGCKSNQGALYPRFDRIVLLSAPATVLLSRVAARTDNPYGKSEAERAEILANLAAVEPLLRATATDEIDATLPPTAVVRALERLAGPLTTP